MVPHFYKKPVGTPFCGALPLRSADQNRGEIITLNSAVSAHIAEPRSRVSHAQESQSNCHRAEITQAICVSAALGRICALHILITRMPKSPQKRRDPPAE